MKLLPAETEYDCYRILAFLKIAKGEVTTYEIADFFCRDVPHTLQSLRYLEHKGLIVKTKPGKPGRNYAPAHWKAKKK